jgi:hypothetical protein
LGFALTAKPQSTHHFLTENVERDAARLEDEVVELP